MLSQIPLINYGIVAVAVFEIISFTIFGAVLIKKFGKGLANIFFSMVFFVGMIGVFANLMAKFLIHLPEFYVLSLLFFGISTLISYIFIFAGFLVIAMGEKNYHRKRGNLFLSFLIIGIIIAFFSIPDGIIFIEIPYGAINFQVSYALGFYFIITLTIFTTATFYLILNSFTKISRREKIRSIGLVFSSGVYWAALTLIILIDMQVIEYDLMGTVLTMFAIGVLILFLGLFSKNPQQHSELKSLEEYKLSKKNKSK
ncbi:MAG: hypothetical protein KAT05_09315 [Spirochaetes bacterium]|nr:hypothetical protein [Spirochaetota bacterium]